MERNFVGLKRSPQYKPKYDKISQRRRTLLAQTVQTVRAIADWMATLCPFMDSGLVDFIHLCVVVVLVLVATTTVSLFDCCNLLLGRKTSFCLPDFFFSNFYLSGRLARQLIRVCVYNSEMKRAVDEYIYDCDSYWQFWMLSAAAAHVKFSRQW